MARNKPPNKGAKPWVWVVAAGLVAAAAIALSLLLQSDHSIAIVLVRPVDADTLLIVGNTGQSTDTTRWGRVAHVDADGVARTWIEEEGELTVIGMTDEVVWLDNYHRHVHARRIADLSLVPGIGEAVGAHDALSARYSVQGYTADAVIVLGPDGRLYAIGLDANISLADPDVARTNRQAPLPRDSDGIPEVDSERARAIVTTLPGLDQAAVVEHAGVGVPVLLYEPTSLLARSFDFVAGKQTDTLHRVGIDGTRHWAIAVTDMIATEGVSSVSIVWVGQLAGALTVLVQETTWHSDEDGQWVVHAQQLVRLDAATGAVVGAVPLAFHTE